jgi:murein DD-endopeptidase MepM/ murein hydrolase activator NlpD
MSDLLTILKNIDQVYVIDKSISKDDYVSIDLSEKNSDLLEIETDNAEVFEGFIENYLSKNNSKVAYGGYIETRNIYKRSTVFKNNNSEERNIHIGLDLWIKAGTNVLAALDGKIHSFQNNTALGDYGPTIILEHTIEDCTFYTLYGHLSSKSLDDKVLGTKVTKGQIIGNLGSPPINGDYAPHLHFQIIKDLEGKKGDYPGVCSQNKLDFYKNNCPDPNLLLKIN